jgi:hypothetical protein
MRRLVGLGALLLAAAWLVVSAGPTFGQSPNGTVTATVTANIGPCISISTNTFSYAPAQFSTSTNTVTTTANSTKPTVTNCSNQTENILAKGGPATGATPNWTLIGGPLNCTEGPNRYRHEIQRSGGGEILALTTTDQTWESAVPGTGSATNTRLLDTILTMPCTGSSGGGATMTVQIFLTAIIP